jgi:hypothetical protein
MSAVHEVSPEYLRQPRSIDELEVTPLLWMSKNADRPRYYSNNKSEPIQTAPITSNSMTIHAMLNRKKNQIRLVSLSRTKAHSRKHIDPNNQSTPHTSRLHPYTSTPRACNHGSPSAHPQQPSRAPHGLCSVVAGRGSAQRRDCDRGYALGVDPNVRGQARAVGSRPSARTACRRVLRLPLRVGLRPIAGIRTSSTLLRTDSRIPPGEQ